MPTHREQILAQFSTKANLFATSPALTDEATLRLLLEVSLATAQDTVLDVGCGAGVVACAFAERVKHATGLDLVPAMIERARALAAEKRLANLTWRVADVLALPFPDESFSLVTSRYALHHFENPLNVLDEMKRVCTRGGRILIADMVTSEEPEEAAALNRMERLRDPSHVNAMSAKELKKLFHDCGLEPAEPCFYHVELELESLLQGSHPLPGDDPNLRAMFSPNGAMETNLRRECGLVWMRYVIAVLLAAKAP